MRAFYRLLYRLLYNQLAWAYDAASWSVSLGRWDQWRRAALPFVRGDNVLEIGFGTGRLLPCLGRSHARVTGLEPSAPMQRIAARRLEKERPAPPRVQGVAQRLPFAPATFDSIVCTFPAAYVLESGVHREIARCLRPGGRLIILELALNTRSPLFNLLFRLLFPSPPSATITLRRAAAGAGLDLEERYVGAGAVQPLVFVAVKGP